MKESQLKTLTTAAVALGVGCLAVGYWLTPVIWLASALPLALLYLWLTDEWKQHEDLRSQMLRDRRLYFYRRMGGNGSSAPTHGPVERP